jgi:ELWxxDGT repeat protein
MTRFRYWIVILVVAFALASGAPGVRTAYAASSVAMVKDLALGTGSSAPSDFETVGSPNVVFGAAGKVWKSNGTGAGTTSLATVANAWSFVRVGARTLFVGNGNQLWRTVGTAAGTHHLATPDDEVGPLSAPLGAKSFFYTWYWHDCCGGTDVTCETSLFGTDGATENFVWAGGEACHLGGVSTPVPMGGLVYFADWDALIRSDGTEAGTTPVTFIGGPAKIRDITAVNGVLYFTADDGTHGSELWRSDGTETGTKLVRDIAPGSASSDPKGFVALGSTVFFQAKTGAKGGELWKTNGTEAGTVLVKDIRAGSASANPYGMIAINPTTLLFAATSANGSELWKTNGTTAGTLLVKDIRVGSIGSSLQSFNKLGSAAVFVANDGVKGAELWRSNGTAAGTSLVKDIRAGATGSSPNNLSVIGGVLWFGADDGSHGVEPWRYVPAS